jgi:chaperone required for assembly of F1-ATPase
VLTGIVAHAAIDGVATNRAHVAAEILKYAGSDLVCYRAGEPQSLVAVQGAAWDPILDWARAVLGARFVLASGVVFAPQPHSAIAAVERAVREIDDPFALAGLSVMTSLTGSVLIALAVARHHISVEDAWRAAHVDEDFQIAHWGADREAMARRERTWSDMRAAALFAAAPIEPR